MSTVSTSSASSFFDRSVESLDVEDFDQQLLDAVVSHWHHELMTASDRDATLSFAGVSIELATHLRLGVSHRTLGLTIPGRRWKAGLLIRTRLEELSLLRSTGHEAFRGCVVVPIVRGGAITGLFARRLDRSREEFWASGLPTSVFEVASGDDAENVLVTSSILDALSVLGALEHATTSYLVVAPGGPKGFSAKDGKELAQRYEHVTALGRDADKIANVFQRSGLACSLAGEGSNVRDALTSSTRPDAILSEWLEHATLLATTPTVTTSKTDHVVAALPSAPEITTTPNRDEVFVTFATRSWRLRGSRSRVNVDAEHLQVALSVSDTTTGRFYLDTLDLYVARQRHGFLDAASSELHASREILNAEVGHVLDVAERRRDDATEESPAVAISDEDRRAALAYLGDPALFERVATDLGQLGVVGEATNLLVCYLATISRKCERPLGVLVQSSSAGGKSTLLDAVCSLLPDEDLVALSAITSQALYYLGRDGLKHKVLYVSEEQGSSRASYALKLLLSEGRLAIATTGKDQRSGRLQTTNYETSGPLALLMTTTSTSIDPELENRLVVVGVSDDPAQTTAILRAQRFEATREGFAWRLRREQLRHLHANVQRLLEPHRVVIDDVPADFATSSTRHRRDHAKVLSLIGTLTVLHQYQRERRDVEVNGVTFTYLQATNDDVTRGMELARELFSRRDDHLAPQAQRLLAAFEDYAALQSREVACAIDEVDVTRRELRELLGWSLMQVRAATDALVALEYLVVAGGGRGRCRTYRLVGALGVVRAVGGEQTPTKHATSSGSTRELVALVPFSSRANGVVNVVTPYEQVNEEAPRP